MSYHYTNQSRETEPTALPDVEVFDSRDYPTEDECEYPRWPDGEGFYYAFGFPGCMWDSEPVGPFETEAEALQDARENAGF
jgi:hypothetical protein